MWKLFRRATLILPPVRRLRAQMHQNADQIANLIRELNDVRAQRDAAIESARRKMSQSQEQLDLLEERVRERDEARGKNDELNDHVQRLELRYQILERDYFASVEAQTALFHFARNQNLQN